LIPYIPDGLELDLFQDKAYFSIIPFMMVGVRPRLALSIPGISTFPEFNIRTYVRHAGKAGVFFLTLDAQSRISCMFAQYLYGLPYRYAKGKLDIHGSTYSWMSKRVKGGQEIIGSCIGTGDTMLAKPGSLDEFLLERYCLYTFHNNNLCIAYIHHNPWIFRKGKADFISNTLTESYDLAISDPLKPDLAHVSEGVLVHTWSIEEVDE
tara:strand:+ start:328 stop:951 length:624 start_codon:yes stop_codon:yes gene_type:complete